jgi:trehalose-6-phosphate synthase
LPLTASRDDAAAGGALRFKMSSGGLVSALASVRGELGFIWLGWLGIEVPENEQPAVRAALLRDHACVPVFLSAALAERYYSGMANDVLWPLLHYALEPGVSTARFDSSLWAAYEEANAAFAAATAEAFAPGDLVWVHDYHLFLLPRMLRSLRPGPAATISFFLHTPFPDASVFSLLPTRREALLGLLGADIAAFHTYDFARYFMRSCATVLPDCARATPSSVVLLAPPPPPLPAHARAHGAFATAAADCAADGVDGVVSALGSGGGSVGGGNSTGRSGNGGSGGGGGGGGGGDDSGSPLVSDDSGSAAPTTTLVRVSPIGIDPEAFLSLAASPAALALLESYSAKFAAPALSTALASASPKGGEAASPASAASSSSSSAAAMAAAAAPAPTAMAPAPSPAAVTVAACEAVRVIVAVDRLDPIKGCVHRLLALQALLRGHREWRGRVALVQVCVPSRADVQAYAALTSRVNELVGSINEEFGSLSWTPVQHLYRSVAPAELAALYSLADVCLVTSLRDGFNLVSNEFVAAQAAGAPCPNRRGVPGVLVLSEFAGASQSLAGALRVNPHDLDGTVAAIVRALTMGDVERRLRHEHNLKYILAHTSKSWALGLVEQMRALADKKDREAAAAAAAAAEAAAVATTTTAETATAAAPVAAATPATTTMSTTTD